MKNELKQFFLLIFWLLIVPTVLHAQNLIQNGSFENYTGNCSQKPCGSYIHYDHTMSCFTQDIRLLGQTGADIA